MSNIGTIISITIIVDDSKESYRDLEHLASELDMLGLNYKWIERNVKSKSEFRRLSSQLKEE